MKAFVLLFFLNVLLVYLHYQDTGGVVLGSVDKSTYDQEIEVTYRADELYIRHHFTNLPTDRLEINWPKESTERTCHIGDTESCVRLNEEATAFSEGGESRQSISYAIPKDAANGNTELLQNVFVKLHGASPGATVLHMADEVNSDGMWITGLQQIGRKKLTLTDYTLYSGSGVVEDLYWLKNEQPIAYSSDHLTVYGEKVEDDFEQYETLLAGLNTPHMALLLTNENEPIVKHRHLMAKPTQLTEVFQQLAVNQYYTNYEVESIDPFTAEVVTAILLGNDFGSSIGKNAVNQMETALTGSQMEQIIEKFKGYYGQPMSAEIADELIEKVIGYGTSFFRKNSDDEQGSYPFLLENPKELVVAGQTRLDKRAIIKGNRTYYPITEIMEAIGYDISWNEQSLYIKNGENNYRFPLNSYFYVLNESRHNTQSLLLTRIGKEFYFEKSAMLRVFRLKHEESSKEIMIKPIGDMKKEVNQ